MGTREGVDERPPSEVDTAPEAARQPRPVRKDEIIVPARGLYIESWLPERRSRRKPLYLLHGELGGSWLWQRYLSYFAQRGWEGHALNLRAHFWSDTADLLPAWTWPATSRTPKPASRHWAGQRCWWATVSGRCWHSRSRSASVLQAWCSSVRPCPVPSGPRRRPHVVRLVPQMFRHELIGWAGPAEQVRRQNPDLTEADVRRVQHLMGAESGAARRQMLEGLPIERDALGGIPTLVLTGGLDRLFPAADGKRLARWLAAEHQRFGAHSHYGLVVGERSHEQVADTIRSFLEANRL